MQNGNQMLRNLELLILSGKAPKKGVMIKFGDRIFTLVRIESSDDIIVSDGEEDFPLPAEKCFLLNDGFVAYSVALNGVVTPWTRQQIIDRDFKMPPMFMYADEDRDIFEQAQEYTRAIMN